MKNKSNLAIIAIVVLAVLTVIIVVIAAGFLNGGKGGSGGSSSVSGGSSETQSADVISSEPSEPSETSEASSQAQSAQPSQPQSSQSSQSSDEPSEPTLETDIGQKIADTASELLGVPFAENGETPEGFDNSGFIYYVLRKNGYITCPRTTAGQSVMGEKTKLDALKKGDPVFFSSDGSDEVSFGGIFIGDGKMIACLMPGTEVKEIDITTDYYVSNFAYGINI